MTVHRMTRFELLANYYRYSDFNHGVDLKHLYTHYYSHPNGRKQYPYLRKRRADGRRSLEETLELFEANIRVVKWLRVFLWMIQISHPSATQRTLSRRPRPSWPSWTKITKQMIYICISQKNMM